MRVPYKISKGAIQEAIANIFLLIGRGSNKSNRKRDKHNTYDFRKILLEAHFGDGRRKRNTRLDPPGS